MRDESPNIHDFHDQQQESASVTELAITSKLEILANSQPSRRQRAQMSTMFDSIKFAVLVEEKVDTTELEDR